jgi:hypothetical protein
MAGSQSEGSRSQAVLSKEAGRKPRCAGSKHHRGSQPCSETAAAETRKVEKKEIDKDAKGRTQDKQEETFPIQSQSMTPTIAGGLTLALSGRSAHFQARGQRKI